MLVDLPAPPQGRGHDRRPGCGHEPSRLQTFRAGPGSAAPAAHRRLRRSRALSLRLPRTSRSRRVVERSATRSSAFHGHRRILLGDQCSVGGRVREAVHAELPAGRQSPASRDYRCRDARRRRRIWPGEMLLVHGAAGAVGTSVVQTSTAPMTRSVIGTAGRARLRCSKRASVAKPVCYGPGLEERVRRAALCKGCGRSDRHSRC